MSQHEKYLMGIDEQEKSLLLTVPFTPEEVRRVKTLFDEERRLMRSRARGAQIPLAQLRRVIAVERVEISRAARRRGLDLWAARVGSWLEKE